MMRCHKCGANLPEDANFCGVCGERNPGFVQNTPATPQAPLPNESTYPGIGGYQPPSVQPGVVSGSISEGWRTFTSHAGMFIGMFVVLIIISAVASGLAKMIGLVAGVEGIESLLGGSIAGAAVATIILWEVVSNLLIGVVGTVLLLGAQVAALRAMRGSQPSFNDLFSVFPLFLSLLGAYIIYALAVLGGLLLLIIPGIIFAIGFYQYSLLIADKKLSAFEAIKTSWAIMRGYKAWFFLLNIALLGINILGILAFVIGLIVTIPLSYVILAAFYRQVLEAYERANGPIARDGAAVPYSG